MLLLDVQGGVRPGHLDQGLLPEGGDSRLAGTQRGSASPGLCVWDSGQQLVRPDSGPTLSLTLSLSVCIKSEDEEDEVCPIKEPRGLVYPWRSTDEEENDLERGLPPLGWTRGVYGGLDPRLGPVLGGGTGVTDNVLEDTVRALQDQLDVLSRRLGGRTRVPDL